MAQIIHTLNLDVLHVVFTGPAQGFAFDQSPSGFYSKRPYSGPNMNQLVIPIDPLTALRLNLVTIDELQISPAMQAFFNMVK